MSGVSGFRLRADYRGVSRDFEAGRSRNCDSPRVMAQTSEQVLWAAVCECRCRCCGQLETAFAYGFFAYPSSVSF